MRQRNQVFVCIFNFTRQGGIGPCLIGSTLKQYPSIHTGSIHQGAGYLKTFAPVQKQNMPASSTDMRCLISMTFLIMAISNEYVSIETLAACKQSGSWMRHQPHNEERQMKYAHARHVLGAARGRKPLFLDILECHGEHLEDRSTAKRKQSSTRIATYSHEELHEPEDDRERKESRAPFESMTRAWRGAQRLRLRGGYARMPEYPHNYTTSEQERKAAGGLPSCFF
jgi:hypothetical protein